MKLLAEYDSEAANGSYSSYESLCGWLRVTLFLLHREFSSKTKTRIEAIVATVRK